MNESAAAKALLLDVKSIGQPESSPSQGRDSASPGSPEALGLDVRSIVEQRFNRMNEAHDRIRSEELALRLGVNEIK
ncbi:MAG: hypothetical protein ACRD8U_18565 [Pyrinomonadaceae bacterium]